jgi:CheY-like chemotaxis protein
LMDLMMPRLDGWEATRRLKADARTKDITIIALSALTQTNVQQVAREAGWDAFIPKPCDLPSLVAVLRGILDHRSDSDNMREPKSASPSSRECM